LPFRDTVNTPNSFGNWVDIVTPRASCCFPAMCPDCRRPAPETSVRISSDEAKLKGFYVVVSTWEHLTLSVPFCNTCARRLCRGSRYGKWLWWAAFASLIGLALWFDLRTPTLLILTLLIWVPAAWLQAYRGWVVRICNYDKETVTLSFKHAEYARQFLQCNQGATILPTSRFRRMMGW